MVVWDWPQITWLVLALIGLGWTIAKHGETTRHNAMSQIIGFALMLVVLLAGGFWHKPEPCESPTPVVPLVE